jgi:Golgi nucleoside diphosphatase
MQAQTKIKLGATAGLRLLPEGKADVILDEVRKFLKTYPFQLDDATGVTILDGVSLKPCRCVMSTSSNVDAASVCSLDCQPVQCCSALR